MRVDIQYGVYMGSKVTGHIETSEENVLCVEGNRVSFLSGFLHGKTEEEVGDSVSQTKVKIVLFQEALGFRTAKVIDLLKTVDGADILPYPHSRAAKGHLLIVHIKTMAIDYVNSLCVD